MLRDVLWPSFPADRILYEDDDLIVIDKPVGVSTHAPDAGRADDAHSRLRRFLAERDRRPLEEVYLGIHQRLDKDTSGALLFTKRKAANAKVAAQFEGRGVQKTYVAALARWPARSDRAVLRDLVARSEKTGLMQVVDQARPPDRAQASRAQASRTPSRARALEAVTHLRVLERAGSRALVELGLETGRTHQIRVQLASRGSPVAGDTLYGGEPAPRLLLHARQLSLASPGDGEQLTVSAPVPPELGEWLAPPTDALTNPSKLERVLARAVEARWALAHAYPAPTAFRLVHAAGDDLADCAVDLYGEHLVLHAFSEAVEAARERIVAALAELGPRGIYFKSHPKHASTLTDQRRAELAPPLPVWGEEAADPLVIEENGLRYRVRLGDGLKTGIFLDQRDNRQRVRGMVKGARVLNLFAYTSAFTVAAAAGGASSTVSVDTSAPALAWGGENLALNGFSETEHALVDEDVWVWLRRAERAGELFDLVILDPPSFATTHTSRFSVERDYPELAAAAMRLVRPGGRLLACTNHAGVPLLKFRRQLHEASRLSSRKLTQVKDLPTPLDFPADPLGNSAFKSVLVQM